MICTGRYCGTGTLPDTLLSSGYRMTVIYRTSSNANKHSGFGATYEGLFSSLANKDLL